jgi:hypothetical protein
LCSATERAAGEMSVAEMSALGRWVASARAMAPVPVPTSRTRSAGGGEVRAGGDPEEDGFDELLGFGARDEGVAGDAEREAVELLGAGEVLERFFGEAAGDESAVGGEDGGGEFGVGVGDEPGAVAEEDVGEEGLGFATSDAGGGFGDGFAESHRAGPARTAGVKTTEKFRNQHNGLR